MILSAYMLSFSNILFVDFCLITSLPLLYFNYLNPSMTFLPFLMNFHNLTLFHNTGSWYAHDLSFTCSILDLSIFKYCSPLVATTTVKYVFGINDSMHGTTLVKENRWMLFCVNCAKGIIISMRLFPSLFYRYGFMINHVV